jgi:hypothetical protein
VKAKSVALPVGRHGAEACQARAAAESEQQGFSLVVRVLGQRNIAHGQALARLLAHFNEGAVAGAACGLFGALARLVASIHPAYPKRHAQGIAKRLPMAHKVICCGLQTVMNVQCEHLTRPPPGASMQQGAGVCSATVGHCKR